MRLGKRERQNKNQMAILKALQGARARMVQGEKSLTKGNFENFIPTGKTRPDWSWKWKDARRIKNNGSWTNPK